MAALDFSALREYVTNGPAIAQSSTASVSAAGSDDTVSLHVTHSHLKRQFPEIRFSLHVSALRYIKKSSSVFPLGEHG